MKHLLKILIKENNIVTGVGFKSVNKKKEKTNILDF